MIARGVRFARAGSSSTSAALLVAFNLVPLAGVLFWGWNVATLLVLYWVENGIVGLLNVPKMLLARGDGMPGASVRSGTAPAPMPLSGDGPAGRVGLVLFFLAHYGIFWLVHGIFVLTLTSFAAHAVEPWFPGPAFPPDVLPGSVDVSGGPAATGPDLSAVAWGALALAISHTASFVVNFVGRREYLTVSPMRQMGAPYGRVVILHLSILLGGFISLALGSPIGAVIVLVLLKTAVDLALHVREHGGVAARPQPA